MKKQLIFGVLFTVASSVAAAHVWIHSQLEDKIGTQEFDRFMSVALRNQEEIQNRLRSIEEAIRQIK